MFNKYFGNVNDISNSGYNKRQQMTISITTLLSLFNFLMVPNLNHYYVWYKLMTFHSTCKNYV